MRDLNVWPKLVLAAVGLSIFPAILPAQVLIVKPACGIAGSSFQITGSGWAEPNPPCEYVFYFDGAEFAPRQPDGLFGPPNTSATVPATATAGDHTIKVELRISADQTLLQCRQTTFKVVASAKDPWDAGNNITTPGGNGIRVEFDPTDVCDVTPCKKIVMTQTVRMQGQKGDGTLSALSFAAQGFPKAATLDADVTAAGYTVDYIVGEADPYYNGDDPADNLQQGLQDGMPVKSIITDGPNRGDAAYPVGIVKITLDFEVAVFCAQGDDKSEFLGMMTWHWERPKAGVATATKLSFSRSAPSADFTAALTLWNTNHGFTLPTATAPMTGGMPCN